MYFRSGASDAFRGVGVDAAEGGRVATLAPGIFDDDAGDLDLSSRAGKLQQRDLRARSAGLGNDGVSYQRSLLSLDRSKKLPSQLSTIVEIVWHLAPRSHALPWALKCVFGRLACVYNHWMRRYPGHGTNIMGGGPCWMGRGELGCFKRRMSQTRKECNRDLSSVDKKIEDD